MKLSLKWLSWCILFIITIFAVVFLRSSFARLSQAEVQVNTNHAVTKQNEPPCYLGEVETGANKYPVGVAVYANELFVSFFKDDKIQVFNLSGKKLREFAIKNTTVHSFPQSIAVIDGQLAITDSLSGFLGFYDRNGKLKDGFFSLDTGINLKPIGITAFDKLYYVTDANLLGWLAIHKTGKLISSFQAKKEKGSLSNPQGIVVTQDGRVIISDNILNKIRVFNCGGWYSYDFDSPNSQETAAPMGMAIDDLGRIHVVDNRVNKIFVFDNFGKFMFTYGQQLNGPTAIAIDSYNRLIFIANTENKAISVWGY